MKIVLIGFLLTFASYSSIGLAQDAGAQFGILYGMSVPDAENSNPRSIYGVKGSANLSSSISLGGYYLVHSTEEGSGGRKFEYSLHGIEGSYRITKGKGTTFVGLRVGLSKIRTETSSNVEYLLSPYHYGLVTGHDFTIMKWMSVGFEGSYMNFDKSKTTESAVLYEEKSFSIISFLVAVQFRF